MILILAVLNGSRVGSETSEGSKLRSPPFLRYAVRWGAVFSFLGLSTNGVREVAPLPRHCSVTDFSLLVFKRER